MTAPPLNPAPFVQIRRSAAPRAAVDLTIDGENVSVPEGTTLLAAARGMGKEIPTLCFLETLKPVNVCRICVVEVEGARVLAPACSRTVEPGMKVQTNSERVRHSRKMILEMLASSVDLSTTPDVADWIEEYGAKPERYGPPAPEDSHRDEALAGHHAPPDVRYAATVRQPVPMIV